LSKGAALLRFGGEFRLYRSNSAALGGENPAMSSSTSHRLRENRRYHLKQVTMIVGSNLRIRKGVGGGTSCFDPLRSAAATLPSHRLPQAGMLDRPYATVFACRKNLFA
jgi:hypothetical protein